MGVRVFADSPCALTSTGEMEAASAGCQIFFETATREAAFDLMDALIRLLLRLRPEARRSSEAAINRQLNALQRLRLRPCE